MPIMPNYPLWNLRNYLWMTKSQLCVKLVIHLLSMSGNYFVYVTGQIWLQVNFDLTYNTRHKSLKQEPFVLNFLQISYIHSSHLCSHSNVPLSFPNVEPRVFWSTEMTAIPNQHWGGENHTSVSRFVTRIVGWFLISNVS